MNMVCVYILHYAKLFISLLFLEPPSWELHILGVIILFAWIELMLLIGRHPTYGYYVLMFTVVLQNVLKVIIPFIKYYLHILTIITKTVLFMILGTCNIYVPHNWLRI